MAKKQAKKKPAKKTAWRLASEELPHGFMSVVVRTSDSLMEGVGFYVPDKRRWRVNGIPTNFVRSWCPIPE